jgi:hypothetical protein
MAAAATGHGDGCLVVERFPPPALKLQEAAQLLPPPPQVTQDLVFPASSPVMFVGQAFGSKGDIQVVTEMVAGSNLGEGEAETFKDVLSALAKEDPARYRRIMDGDEVMSQPLFTPCSPPPPPARRFRMPLTGSACAGRQDDRRAVRALRRKEKRRARGGGGGRHGGRPLQGHVGPCPQHRHEGGRPRIRPAIASAPPPHPTPPQTTLFQLSAHS